MFKIYNKSSIDMKEINDNSIDLIITSPPFNLGTLYVDFKDNMPNLEYFKILKAVFSECFRVLKKEGLLIVEVSDTIFTNSTYIELAGLVQSYCTSLGFTLKKRDYNFAVTKNHVQIPDHGWDKDYTTKTNAHSNLNQVLIFSKGKIEFDEKSKTTYSNYVSSDTHPCPFPKFHINHFLNIYFKAGMTVLDPFMGTADLGVEVLKRKGNYFGYDVVKEFYNNANEKLSKIKL